MNHVVFRHLGIGLNLALAISLAGCTSLGSSGPRSGAVRNASGEAVSGAKVQIVEVTDTVARRLVQSSRHTSFVDAFNEGSGRALIVGPGDVLDISIWESPPAALFGTSVSDARLAGATGVARNTALPEQMVREDGKIAVPFAGEIQAAGRSLQQIQREIAARLKGIANLPQVIVRLARNNTTNVTVVGEVENNLRMPLTAKGERLLDALASAGGAKQPVGKTTIQVSRQGRVASLPLDVIIRDPQQNIRLQPDDVVTAYFQPYSFTALGAIGANAEVPFEGTGLTLSQALGRIGGLRDDRADVKGVFIFRFENPKLLDPATIEGATLTPDGKIPVIYRVDLSNPASFFSAQSFPIDNKDVIYVSNAPGADLQKFVGIVSSIVFSVVSVGNSF